MARKKVKLAWIANDSARRATFKKRKKGLMKKVSELSTLCGVSACAIVYGPYDPQPEIWPSAFSDVHRVLAAFKDLPEMEQSKKMMDQEGFFRQRILKTKEQVKRQQRENRELEMTHLMYQSLSGKGLQEVGTQDLNDLAWLVEEKMKAIHDKIEMLRREAAPQMTTMMGDDHQRLKNCKVISQDHDMSLEVAMEALQRQTWFKEVINSQDHFGYFGDDIEGLVWGY